MQRAGIFIFTVNKVHHATTVAFPLPQLPYIFNFIRVVFSANNMDGMPLSYEGFRQIPGKLIAARTRQIETVE